MSTRGRYDSSTREVTERVQVHTGIWISGIIMTFVILAIFGMVIATLVKVEDNNKEVNRIKDTTRKVRDFFGIDTSSSSSSDDDDDDHHYKKCPTCLQPFGPCTKRLPELLHGYPCCVTLFQDKFVDVIPIKPKHKKDSHDSRWGYESFDENCKGHRMSVDHGKWYEADDCVVSQGDSYIDIESAPFKYSVDAGEMGKGTGIFDTVKSALTPFGSYGVKKGVKIVLQAVVKVYVKFPKWHPYEQDSYDDPRKAYAGPVFWDKHSGMKIGVGFTEKGVWVMHHRMSMYKDVANWHSAKRVHDNSYGKEFCIRIVYCSKTNTFTVYINDKEVYVVEKPGHLPKEEHRDMYVHRGGEEDDAYPQEMKAYIMTGSVMDASLRDHDEKGLVQLDDYSYVEPKEFRYGMKDSKKKRVFGQRVKIVVVKFKVDVCEPEEEKPKEKPKKSHSKSHSKSKSRSHHSRSSGSEDDRDWKDDKEWKDDKQWKDDKEWKDDKQWKDDKEWRSDDKEEKGGGSLHIEHHEKSEDWESRNKEKWEVSNSDNFKLWADEDGIDVVHQKSENEEHKKESAQKHSKSEEWNKVDADNWHDFQE